MCQVLCMLLKSAKRKSLQNNCKTIFLKKDTVKLYLAQAVWKGHRLPVLLCPLLNPLDPHRILDEMLPVVTKR